MNVLLLVIDALGPAYVDPALMPALADLADRGGRHPEGGLAVMPASTYPNHATFVTGVGPAGHGLWAAETVRDGRRQAAWDAGPAVPTLFDACRAAGRSSVAVLGDHHLVGTMGAAAADRAWPGPTLPAGAALDPFGYLADEAVAPVLAAAVADGPDLLVAQLNGPDTAAHLYGPDSEAARAAYAVTDRALGEVCEALRPRFSDWVVLVVSDHCQEDAAGDRFVDLERAAASAGVEAGVIEDGSAAVVYGPGGAAPGWLASVPGVAGVEALAPGAAVAWTEPGGAFARGPWPLPGIHGSPRTRAQVAVVGGGHRAVAPLAARVAAARPPATAWARWTAELLGLPGPEAW